MRKTKCLAFALMMTASLALAGCAKTAGTEPTKDGGAQTTAAAQEPGAAQSSGMQQESSAAQSEAGTQTAAEPQKIDGGTMIIPEPGDISSLNIWYETGDEGMTMLKPVYDPLFITDRGEVRYYLAESFEVSEDGLQITVKLRDNMTWHDGEPITADDLIFTFDIKNDPNTSASSGTKVDGELVAYEKVDDLTVRFTLPKVYAAYLETLGSIRMMPKHVYEGETDMANSQLNQTQGVGSGPYMVKEWNKGENLTLVRYEDYYRGKPNLESVVFKIIPNESTQEIAFQNGEINLFPISLGEKLSKYSADENLNVYSFPRGRVNYMGFNSNSENMKDIKARQAIAAAINLNELVLGAYGENIAEPATNFFGPGVPYYDANVTNYEYNLDQAKQLAEEAGLVGKTLKLVYNNSRSNQEETALILQQQLKAIGVNLEATGYDTQGFFEVFFYTDLGDWDLGLNGYAANAGPNSIRYMFSSDGFLTKNVFTSDEALALWQDGNATFDEAERETIYKKLQQQIKDDYCMYPIAYPNWIAATDKGLMGIDSLQVVPVFEDYLEIYRVE